MPRTRNWLPWLCLGAVYLLLVAISWKRWANPIVDCGREMYVPWQITEGKMLYRDLFWMYGPLVPYWHALLFHIFGVHLNVLYFIGLLLTAAQAALVFLIARRVLSESLAVLAALLFLVQFAFRPALGNLVFPYSFNAAYASTLNLLALWLVLRHREAKDAGRPLLLAGICIGLSLLSKQEIGLAGFVFLVIYSFSLRRHFKPVHPPSRVKRPPQPRGRHAALRGSILHPLLLAILLPLLGYGWFASQLGLDAFMHEYLWPRDVLKEMELFHRVAVGTLFSPRAIVYLIGLIVATAGPLAAVLCVAYALDRRLHPAAAVAWIMLVAVGIVASPLSDRFFRFLELNHIHAANILVLLFAVVHGIRSRSMLDAPRSPSTLLGALSGSRNGTLFWIALLALLATWRAPLFAGVSAYSAFFMPASVIVFVWVWAEALPSFWKTIDATAWRRCAMLALSVFCILQLGRHLTHYRVELTSSLSTARGEMIVHKDIGRPLREAMEFLELNTRADEALLLFPEETSLYFLCERRSPSKYYQFAPGLLSPERKEHELIAAADAARVRFVFVSNRATTEYGKAYFGLDYYPRLREWLLADFQLVKTIGNPIRSLPPPPPSRYWPSDGYGIEIYERIN